MTKDYKESMMSSIIHKFGGVYKITNKVNGKIYVGSSVNIYTRQSQHFSKLRRQIHSNRHLQSSYNKYGENAFEFSVLKIVKDNKDLIKEEQYFIDLLKPQYNKRLIAHSNLGIKLSEETKRKFRNRVYTEEIRRNMSLAHLGKKISEETKKKMSESAPKKHSAEHNRNVSLAKKGKSNSLLGRKMSQETKDKISKAKKGRPNGLLGKKLTEEHKKNALLGKKKAKEKRLFQTIRRIYTHE